jgi:hypothetical protein
MRLGRFIRVVRFYPPVRITRLDTLTGVAPVGPPAATPSLVGAAVDGFRRRRPFLGRRLLGHRPAWRSSRGWLNWWASGPGWHVRRW